MSTENGGFLSETETETQTLPNEGESEIEESGEKKSHNTKVVFFDAPYHTDPRLIGQALDDAGMGKEIPRGALSIATLLDRKGYDCKVVPMDAFLGYEIEKKRKEFFDEARADEQSSNEHEGTHATPHTTQLQRQVTSEGYFNDFLKETVSEQIQRENPRVIGISYMFSATDPSVMAMVKFIRENFPDKLIVLGGSAASFDKNAKERLLNPDDVGADLIIDAEGEWTMLDLVNRIEENPEISREELSDINGTSSWRDGKVFPKAGRSRGDPSEIGKLEYNRLVLPPSETSLAGFNHYVLFARGCKGRCAFCVSREKYKGVVTDMGLKSFEEELYNVAKEVNKREPGEPTNIGILDDDIWLELPIDANGEVADKDEDAVACKSVFRIIQPVLEKIHQDFPDITFDVQARVGHLRDAQTEGPFIQKPKPWQEANTRIGERDGDSADKLLTDMIKVGVNNVLLGIESGSEQILTASQKDEEVDWIIPVCRKIKSAKAEVVEEGIIKEKELNTVAFWIVGLPGSNPKEERASTSLLAQLVDEQLVDEIETHVFVPLPGSIARSQGFQNWLAKRFNIKMNIDTSEEVITKSLFSDEPTIEYSHADTGEVLFSREQIHLAYLETKALAEKLKENKKRKNEKPLIDMKNER